MIMKFKALQLLENNDRNMRSLGCVDLELDCLFNLKCYCDRCSSIGRRTNAGHTVWS